MILILGVVLAIVLGAAAAARWTPMHPLVIAGLAGLPGAVLGLFAGFATLSPALGLVAIGFVVAAVAGALGAFLGWLRRDYHRRNA